eukprot:Awhi_evm1s11979
MNLSSISFHGTIYNIIQKAEKVIYNILEVGTFIQEHNRGLKRTPGYTSLEYDDLAIVLFCLASTIALN